MKLDLRKIFPGQDEELSHAIRNCFKGGELLANQTHVPRHFIVATAGHVDHGKSSLVKALTGTDPHRLPEENPRGITLDLVFAHLELRSPNDRSFRYDIVLVDCPCHENRVRHTL